MDYPNGGGGMKWVTDWVENMYLRKFRDHFVEEYDCPMINRMASADCVLILTGAASPTPGSIVVTYKPFFVDRPIIMRGWHIPVQTNPTDGTKMRLVLMEADATTKLPTTRIAGSDSGWFDVSSANTTIGDAGGDNHKQVALASAGRYSLGRPRLCYIGFACTSPVAGGNFRGRSNRDIIKGRRAMQYTGATDLNANYATFNIPESPAAGSLAAAGDATNGNIGFRLLCALTMAGNIS